jgi:2-methylcitrate dehydratase PrpD
LSDSIAHRLAAEMAAQYAHGGAAVAEPVLERARDLLLDHVGVTLGGVPEPSSRAVRTALAALRAHGAATVLGTDLRLPAPDAALANGAAAHALEMDDTHQGGSIHLGAAVIPAALAASELRRVGGVDFLRAVIAGYDVAGRLAMALDPAAHYARGFHPTGTCGTFGAATAAGLSLGLDAAGVRAALGVAGSQAAGSMEFLSDGAWTKRLHPGWAAHAGLYAAVLAQAGYSAPASIFEGRFGTLHAYSDRARAGALRPAAEPVLMRTSIKPHACCRYAQGPIDAVLRLRAAHGLDPRDVARIEVGLVDAAFPIICEPLAAKRRPTSVVDAQFSLPFSVAVALIDGDAGPDRFTPERAGDPLVRQVMDTVEPTRDAALDARYPAVWPVWVRLTLRDGRRLDAHVDHPTGDPERFPTRDELLAKFRTLAARTLPPSETQRLATTIAALHQQADVSVLLRPGRPSDDPSSAPA